MITCFRFGKKLATKLSIEMASDRLKSAAVFSDSANMLYYYVRRTRPRVNSVPFMPPPFGPPLVEEWFLPQGQLRIAFLT